MDIGEKTAVLKAHIGEIARATYGHNLCMYGELNEAENAGWWTINNHGSYLSFRAQDIGYLARKGREPDMVIGHIE